MTGHDLNKSVVPFLSLLPHAYDIVVVKQDLEPLAM